MYKFLAAGATALVLSSPAFAVTIDFDELANGTFVDTQYEALGVNFSSTGGGVSVFTFAGADTPSNTFGGTNVNGGLDFSQDVVMTFVQNGLDAVTDFVSVAFTDLELIGNTLTAFDVNGVQLGQVVAPCAAEFACGNLIETLSFSGAGIHTVVLQGAGGGGRADIAFDTVIFNDVTPVAAVPLPAGLPLALSGLGLLLATSRRKRS